MFQNALSKGKQGSLLGDYASLLGDAVLRHRTRSAEHSARIEAELASKVKSEFIANMSHELRTPLNTVMGFSKLLAEHEKRRLPDNEVIEYSKLIRDAATHLLSVINDILDISKIQSGRYTLDSREIAVDDILSACLSQHLGMAAEAQVELTLSPLPELPRVRGDVAKLKQVFANLTSNAVKFTPPGGRAKIEAANRSDGGVTVHIRDTGIGMTPEELHIAMTLFGQVDGGRTRWREGTGLGLPIAKALVELHGGKLEIESTKSRGTTVTVTLPSVHQVSVSKGRDAILGLGSLD